MEEVHGRIGQGPLTSWLDRDCTHIDAVGELIMDTQVSPIQQQFQNGIKYTIAGQEVSNICYFGHDVLEMVDGWTNLGDKGPHHYAVMRTFLRQINGYIFSTRIFAVFTEDKLDSGLPWSYSKEEYRFDANLKYMRLRSRDSGPVLNFKQISEYDSPFYVPILSTATRPSYLAASPFLDSIESFAIFAQHRLVPRFIADYDMSDEYDYSIIRGELAQEAIEHASLTDSNMLESLSEIKTVPSSFLSWVPKGASAKDLSKSFLGLKYGPLTTIREMEGLLQGIVRDIKRGKWEQASCHSQWTSQHNGSTIDYHYKVVYQRHSQQILKLVQFLDDYSILPSVEKAWDFIPLSFVIDWMSGFGDCLANFDFKTKALKYDVIGVTYSRKLTRPFNVTEYGSGTRFLGYAEHVVYQRVTDEDIDMPHFFSPRLQDVQFSNTVDLVALILAKSK